jgi:hypothetical protein
VPVWVTVPLQALVIFSSPGNGRAGGQVLHAVLLTAKLAGAALLLV